MTTAQLTRPASITLTAADIPLPLHIVARAARRANESAYIVQAFRWGCERARRDLALHRSRP